MKSFHSESINKTTPKYKIEHDFACENTTKVNQRMEKLKHEGDIGGNQGSKHFKPLFMGTRTFI
jgi:hypothetical protein